MKSKKVTAYIRKDGKWIEIPGLRGETIIMLCRMLKVMRDELMKDRRERNDETSRR